MNKLITLLILFALYANAIKILTYDKPGTYFLTPTNYENASSFIINLWSAGMAGTVNGNGGCSGAFATMNIISQNENFNLIIGKGGNSCSYANHCTFDYYCSGITSSINNYRINVTLGCEINSITNKVISQNCYNYSGCVLLDKINGNAGKPKIDAGLNSCNMPCNGDSFYVGTGVGGYAPFGGFGGCLGNCESIVAVYCDSYKMNGTNGNSPGGGGGAAFCDTFNNYCGDVYGGSGGSGLAIIYYEPTLTQTITPTTTITPTITPTSTMTPTPTMTSISTTITLTLTTTQSQIISVSLCLAYLKVLLHTNLKIHKNHI